MNLKVSRFMAKQYANPSGWFGRIFTAAMLNRANQQSGLSLVREQRSRFDEPKLSEEYV
ncbi:MAG: hypothetical protein ACPGSM_17590 [Thiolinea sp.]